MSKGVVEINGHRYDAATGKLLGVVHKAATSITPLPGQVMDGFVRRPVKALVPKEVSRNVKQVAQQIHKKTSRSQTLMRSVVSQPKVKPAPKPAASQPMKRRPGVINSKRLFRAKTVLRSSGISHFKKGDNAKEGEVLPRSMAAKVAGSSTRAVSLPLPTAMASVSHNQLERLLDHALERASAHRRALRDSARGPLRHFSRLPRWLSVLIVLFVVGVVGGFMAWQKVPAVSLKLASSKAHVAASLPDYTPYGFSIAGPAKASADAVSLTYKSKADKQADYVVTQKISSASTDNLPLTILPAGTPVQTSNDNNSKSPVISGVNKDKENVATCLIDGKQVIVTGGPDINETQKVAGSLCH